jgi:hypothetical protein
VRAEVGAIFSEVEPPATPIAAGYQILIYSIFPLQAFDRYGRLHGKVDQSLNGSGETFCKRNKRLAALLGSRKFLPGRLKGFSAALCRQPAAGLKRELKVGRLKMGKPMQANVAVFGAGVGVLSFATGDRGLPSKTLIAAAVAAQSLRLLDRPGANENDLETEILQRPLKVAGMTPRLS